MRLRVPLRTRASVAEVLQATHQLPGLDGACLKQDAEQVGVRDCVLVNVT